MINHGECRNGGKRKRFRFRQGRGRNHIHAHTCGGARKTVHADCSLRELHPGETAVVMSLTHESGYRKKLLSLGMLPGSRIECVRGGNGSGICIRFSGSTLSGSTFMINSHMADHIQVARVS